MSKAYGFIQWKGTDVCMDVNCSCGELSHVDGMFMYKVCCPACGRVYKCDDTIRLIEEKSND